MLLLESDFTSVGIILMLSVSWYFFWDHSAGRLSVFSFWTSFVSIWKKVLGQNINADNSIFLKSFSFYLVKHTKVAATSELELHLWSKPFARVWSFLFLMRWVGENVISRSKIWKAGYRHLLAVCPWGRLPFCSNVVWPLRFVVEQGRNLCHFFGVIEKGLKELEQSLIKCTTLLQTLRSSSFVERPAAVGSFCLLSISLVFVLPQHCCFITSTDF